jgi:hypothetical protein
MTAEFGSNLRVRLSADVSAITIGGTVTTSRIRGTLVDENSTTVINRTGTDITVQLSASGTDGTLTDLFLTIPQGTSSSYGYDDGLFAAGAQAGTVTISGLTTGTQRFTVDSTSIALTTPTIGAGAHWDVVTYQPYTPGQQGLFYVRLMDANGTMIPGNYAFQLTLSTSNNEPKVSGIPTGVTMLTLGSTTLNPVSDGIAEGAANDGNDVVVRTAGGNASFKIAYNKPGQVIVTVTGVPGSTYAFAQDGTVGTATSAYGVPDKAVNLTFTQTPTALKLLADSDGLGNGVNAGATRFGRPITLHAYLTDNNGNWTPAKSATITLTKVSGTNTTLPSVTTVTAVDGKADFVVYANNVSNTAGEDVYKVTTSLSGISVSSTITLQVQTSVPAATSIIATRGNNNGSAGALNFVAPTDTGLEFELLPDSNQHWVVAKVYSENGSTALYTSAPVDMTSAAPRIVVPKSALPNGITRYQVTLRNGYGESARSLSTNQVTNAVLVTNFSITSAKYQRATQLMTINGSGFTSTTDTVNPALLTIHDASTGANLILAGAQVTINSRTQITLNLTGVAAPLDPLSFSGSDVGLTAAAGWYTRSNGEQSSALTTVAPVGPMATMKYVVYDRVNSRLYLNGDGFNSVSLNFTKLKLQSPTANDIPLSGFTSTRTNDSQWLVNLNSNTPAANAALAALDAHSDFTLTTQDGWAYDSSWIETAIATPLPMFAQISLSSVKYDPLTHKLTLNGTGFQNGTITTIGDLKLTDKTMNQTVQLSGTALVNGDAEIVFTLDGAADQLLVSRPNTDTIYLMGDPGWFTNAAGRPAAGIPDRTLRLAQQ